MDRLCERYTHQQLQNIISEYHISFQWVYLNYLEHLNSGFENVIWSDETAVQLESHRRHSYRKKGEQATLKPRPKHPIKLHVWAGFSKRGPTPIVIFNGIMNADLYVSILQRGLLPDLNPIENLWHELKEYLRREVKPTRESELTAGITRFWDCF